MTSRAGKRVLSGESLGQGTSRSGEAWIYVLGQRGIQWRFQERDGWVEAAGRILCEHTVSVQYRYPPLHSQASASASGARRRPIRAAYL